jgi:hypothetical protein
VKTELSIWVDDHDLKGNAAGHDLSVKMDRWQALVAKARVTSI